MTVLLAALSAAVYGSADYCGGVATRRTGNPIAVTVLSQLISVPAVLVAALLVIGTPQPVDLGWGVVAGAAGLAGLVLLYRGLSSGAMAVVAPTTAVTAAVVPLLIGLYLERWPQPWALAGLGCAVVAIGLVSLAPNGERSVVTPALLASAVVAGVMFGLFFTALDRAGSDAGIWPLVSARVTSVGLGLVVLLIAASRAKAAGRSLGTLAGSWWWVATAGLLDVAANGLYLLAAQQGALSIVAPVASLYPVSTVVLALTLDRERLRPLQLVGLGLAATALVLVSGSA